MKKEKRVRAIFLEVITAFLICNSLSLFSQKETGLWAYVRNNKLIQGHYTFSKNKADAKNAFTFLASNSSVEWALIGNKAGNWFIVTLHQNGQAPLPKFLSGYEDRKTASFLHKNIPVLTVFTDFDIQSIIYDAHSHPDGSTEKDFKPSNQDVSIADDTRKENLNIEFWLFAPKNPASKWIKY